MSERSPRDKNPDDSDHRLSDGYLRRWAPVHRKKRKLSLAGNTLDFALTVAITVLVIFWVLIIVFLIQTVHDVTYCIDRDFKGLSQKAPKRCETAVEDKVNDLAFCLLNQQL